MSRRLVSSWVQVKRDHESAAVIRSLNVGTTIVKGNVGIIECGRESIINRDAMRLDGASL